MRALAVALLGMAFVASACAEGETWAGLPRAQRAGADWETRVLQNPGFLVGYSESRRQPLWVAYRAETLKGTAPLPPRPRFEADPRVARGVSYFDYRGSHYTRGHLAPNYLIGKLYGADAQRATFLMTNISPQSQRLNELVWQRIEEAESDLVAPSAVQLWVLAGPLFDAHPETFRKGIAVPAAFYRIWLDLDRGQPRGLAFIVPQQVCGTEPLSGYLASVDQIEQRAGLDFFSELPDAQEDALERSRSPDGWRLDRFDRRMPRYGDKFDTSQCEH